MKRSRQSPDATGMEVMSISQMAGIHPRTLRAWENRYQALTPKRSSSGRRRYSETHLERLRLLVTLVERGHPISTIAHLSDQQLKHRIGKTLDSLPNELLSLEAQLSIETIIGALSRYDLKSVVRELSHCRNQMDIRQFTLEFISPLLTRIGQLVDKKNLSIDQEHCLSALLRDLIGQILSAQNTHLMTHGPVLACAPEGNLHEFGILCSILISTARGVAFHNLGSNLPAAALIHACKALEPKVVIISAPEIPSYLSPITTEDYIQQVKHSVSKKTEIWVGGVQRARALSQIKKMTNVHLLKSFYELDQKLEQLKGK